jgi:hypothetical protein
MQEWTENLQLLGDPPLFLGGGGAPPQEHYSYTGAAPRPPRRSQAPPPHTPLSFITVTRRLERAPRRHCSTGNHRRMIRLRRAPAAPAAAPAAGCLRQRLRRAPSLLRRASLHLLQHLRRAVLDSACGWRSPAAGRLLQRLRRAGKPTYRTAAAGEPTYRTAAGGAFARGSGGAGGIAYLRWRLRQAGAGSVRRGLELGAEVGRRLRWDLAAL